MTYDIRLVSMPGGWYAYRLGYRIARVESHASGPIIHMVIGTSGLNLYGAIHRMAQARLDILRQVYEAQDLLTYPACPDCGGMLEGITEEIELESGTVVEGRSCWYCPGCEYSRED